MDLRTTQRTNMGVFFSRVRVRVHVHPSKIARFLKNLPFVQHEHKGRVPFLRVRVRARARSFRPCSFLVLVFMFMFVSGSFARAA